MTWSLAPANTPRFLLQDNELLVEGARGNGIRNALALGAPALPTHWTKPNAASGLTVAFAPISEGVLNGVRITYSGTTAASPGPDTTEFDSRTQFVINPGAPCAGSFLYRLASGSIPAGVTPQSRFVSFTAAGTLAQISSQGLIAPDATIRRATHVFTPPAGVGPNGYAVHGLHFQAWPANTPVAFALDLFWPQLEPGAFASSPILPAPGTIAASSRGDEGLTVLLSDVLVPASGACTLLLAGRLGQAAPAGVTQMLAQIDDGTDANRVLVYCAPGTASLRMRAVLAGVPGAEVILGTVVPGQIWRLVASLDGGGRLAASLDGAAALALTGGPAAGLVAALFGTSRAGEALFGTLRHIQVIPATTQDAALPALAALIP